LILIEATPLRTIPPALLGRAKSLAAEHDQLVKQLANGYDPQIARKVGELSQTAKALNAWNSASNVCFSL